MKSTRIDAPKAEYDYNKAASRERGSGSLYLKLFFSIVLILVMCLVAFGAILFNMLSSYVETEKQNQLYSVATKVSDMTTVLMENYTVSAEYSYVTFLNIYNESMNSDTIVTDTSGKILYAAVRTDMPFDRTDVPQEYLNDVMKGDTFAESASEEGFYPKNAYVVGVPVYGSDSKVIGAVFVSTTLPLNYFINNIKGYYIIAVLIILILCCIATYIMSLRMIKPLQRMSVAVRQFAKGNFDVYVPVTSNDEIGDLAMAFNNMAASLRNIDKMRNDFIANVSHDLRTPMTVIAGFMDGILDNTIKPEEHRKYLIVVRNEVLRLSRLVKNLLDIAKIEAGELKLNLVDFNVCEMMSNILLSFEAAISSKQIEVDVDFLSPTINVTADYDSIFQVIYNLCDNAVKFTNQGGSLKIMIMPQGKKAHISVKNSGEGIMPDELPRLFEKFYKSDRSRSLDKRGTGLGLYICKTIINRHGEDITVKSVMGEYTEFAFDLPLADGKKKQ
ncbi:MAG: HAMP domain-containing histidine kinase [Clostridia bacterium]|nr:HAMP domain-containing histidine kinase [Clostridia bacterium]